MCDDTEAIAEILVGISSRYRGLQSALRIKPSIIARAGVQTRSSRMPKRHKKGVSFSSECHTLLFDSTETPLALQLKDMEVYTVATKQDGGPGALNGLPKLDKSKKRVRSNAMLYESDFIDDASILMSEEDYLSLRADVMASSRKSDMLAEEAWKLIGEEVEV